MVFKPTTKKELEDAVKIYFTNNDESIKQYGIIGEWDVSLITDMSHLFFIERNIVSNSIDIQVNSSYTDDFNQSLSNWDVSNVTNMSCMFKNYKTFNQSLNNWDVSNVTDMNGMFWGCTSFNQLLNNWNVSNVTDMSRTFSFCESLNQSLNDWDVSNVTNMSYMFLACKSFNHPLNNWDVSNVTDMQEMFSGCKSFNQPLNNWNVSNVTDMHKLFIWCNEFNQPLNKWNVSNVTDTSLMFSSCIKFNQSLNEWNVSNVKYMYNMFSGCNKFNYPISNWNTSNVIRMEDMFSENCLFNQAVVMLHIIPRYSTMNYNPSLLDSLVDKPYTLKQRDIIITNNIMHTPIINIIYYNRNKLIVPEYKDVFKGYKMPYKIVNYAMLCILEHFGIKMIESIDYNRFNNNLLVDLHINKRNTIVKELIIHIKKTNKKRYDNLEENLKKLFSEKLNKDVNVMIYNNNILFNED